MQDVVIAVHVVQIIVDRFTHNSLFLSVEMHSMSYSLIRDVGGGEAL
jgi:hypothetical protein